MKSFTWSQLKRVGSSYPSKISILIPFLGHFLLFQEQILNFIMKSYSFNEISFMNNVSQGSIFIFYYGLFIFGVGSIVYHFFAPTAVSVYADKNHFIDNAVDKIVMGNLFADLNNIQNIKLDPETKKQAKFYCNALTSGIMGDKTKDAAIFTYSLYFDIENKKHAVARFIVAFFFGSGLFLISVPSLILFGRVSSKLVHIVGLH